MSVLELARIFVKDGSQEEFETAFTQAHGYVQAAEGHESSELVKSTSSDTEYVFLVRWRHLADHIDSFLPSPEFAAFGGLIGPYFAAEPAVDHFQTVKGVS